MRASRLLVCLTFATACEGIADLSGPTSGEGQAPVLVDADQDGLDDGWEQTLAARFAPQIRLAPSSQDWTRPANVDWYLLRVSMRFNHAHCPDHQVLALGAGTQSNLASQTHPTDNFWCSHTSTIESSGGAHPEFFLQPSDTATHNGSSNPADWRVYAHVKPSTQVTGGVDIQYWFFYAYDFTSVGANHEADWEHVTITADAAGNFATAWYAQHDGGTRYAAAALTWMGGTHPVVYSAVGTHASYPSAGSFFVSESGLYDYTYDGGPQWDAGANLINVGEKGYPLGGQRFIQYGGRWGEIGNFSFTTGPITPSYQPTWTTQ